LLPATRVIRVDPPEDQSRSARLVYLFASQGSGRHRGHDTAAGQSDAGIPVYPMQGIETLIVIPEARPGSIRARM
jgi:hypothetical protein